jgi:hypothetical protein
MRKNPIDELYFGVVTIDFNSKRLKTQNLFASWRVRHAIAVYVADKEKIKASLPNLLPLHFCFGDTQGRCEYETLFYAQEYPNTVASKVIKTDVYEMYVKPNADYLMSLVDSISEKDAKKWLKKEENGTH